MQKRTPLFPGYPDWALNIDPESLDNLSEHLASPLSLFRTAENNNVASAAEIALRYENGRMINSPNIEESIRWYIFAAELGGVFPALRAAQLMNFMSKKSNYEAIIGMAKLAISNVLSRSHKNKESLFAAISAAKLLLEDERGEVDSLEIVEMLLKEPNLEDCPDVGEVAKKLRQIKAGKGLDNLSLKVAQSKITDDAEFKVGVYKVLETPLPLIATPNNPEAIKKTLNAEFPWFQEINEIIYRQLVTSQYNPVNAFKLRPLLLAGAPGVGKTSWAQRLTKLCGVPSRVVMAGGGADAMFLRGLARGWSSSRPGAVIQTMATEMVANPLFMVDELDKASPSSHNGRIWDVLLQLLEPATSKAYLDECLQIPCDLSMVSWIATVNELGQIPKPLLERFTIVYVPAPEKKHFAGLLQGVVNNYAKELGFDVRMLPLLDNDEIEVLRRCNGPREINRACRQMLERKLVHIRNHSMTN